MNGNGALHLSGDQPIFALSHRGMDGGCAFSPPEGVRRSSGTWNLHRFGKFYCEEVLYMLTESVSMKWKLVGDASDSKVGL